MATDWRKSTVTELQTALKERGLLTTGKRTILIERLTEYENSQEQSKNGDQEDEEMNGEEEKSDQPEPEAEEESMETGAIQDDEGENDAEAVAAEDEHDSDAEALAEDEDEHDDDEEKPEGEEAEGADGKKKAPYIWKARYLVRRDPKGVELYKRKLTRENLTLMFPHPVKSFLKASISVSEDSVNTRVLVYPIEVEDFANESFQEIMKKALRVSTHSYTVPTEDGGKQIKSFVDMLFKKHADIKEALPILKGLREDIQTFHKPTDRRKTVEKFLEDFGEVLGIDSDHNECTLYTYPPEHLGLEHLRKTFPMAHQIKLNPMHDRRGTYIYFLSKKVLQANIDWLEENLPEEAIRKMHCFVLADLIKPLMDESEFGLIRNKKKKKYSASAEDDQSLGKPKSGLSRGNMRGGRWNVSRGRGAFMHPQFPDSQKRPFSGGVPTAWDLPKAPKRMRPGPGGFGNLGGPDPYVSESIKLIMDASARLKEMEVGAPSYPLSSRGGFPGRQFPGRVPDADFMPTSRGFRGGGPRRGFGGQGSRRGRFGGGGW